VYADGPQEMTVQIYTYEKSRLVQNRLLYWVVECEGEEVDRWRA